MSKPNRNKAFRYVIFVGVTISILMVAMGIVFFADRWIFGIFAIPVAATIGWLFSEHFFLRAQANEREKQIEIRQARCMKNQRRLDGVLRLTRELVSNLDEKQLISSGLEIAAQQTGAFAAAYISLDENELQSMPVVVYGSMPRDVLEKWAEHLESPIVRKECKNCTRYTVISSGECTDFRGLNPGPFNVHIFPFCRDDKRLGVMQLYCDADLVINQEDQDFLSMIVGEMVVIFQRLRLRNQELVILRQLQKLHTSHSSLNELLGAMMSGLMKILEMDSVIIQTEGHDHSGVMRFEFGKIGEINAEELLKIANGFSEKKDLIFLPHNGSNAVFSGKSAIVLPLIRNEKNQVLGVLMAAGSGIELLSAEQIKAALTISKQAALMIETDQDRLNLEYRAIMEERSHLAREIHDGLAQELAYLNIQSFKAYTQLINGDITTARDLMKEQNQVLAKSYMEVRQVIDNLRLAPEQGLKDWIQQAAVDFKETTKIPLTLQLVLLPDDGGLPLEIQAQLIRIVQEALNNIRRHADARQVNIHVNQTDQELCLEIEDDGQGFSVEKMQSAEKHGLKGIHERARLIGAEVHIDSQPGKGTIVRLLLPASEWESIR